MTIRKCAERICAYLMDSCGHDTDNSDRSEIESIIREELQGHEAGAVATIKVGDVGQVDLTWHKLPSEIGSCDLYPYPPAATQEREEPVAWILPVFSNGKRDHKFFAGPEAPTKLGSGWIPLYSSPPISTGATGEAPATAYLKKSISLAAKMASDLRDELDFDDNDDPQYCAAKDIETHLLGTLIGLKQDFPNAEHPLTTTDAEALDVEAIAKEVWLTCAASQRPYTGASQKMIADCIRKHSLAVPAKAAPEAETAAEEIVDFIGHGMLTSAGVLNRVKEVAAIILKHLPPDDKDYVRGPMVAAQSEKPHE